MQQTTNYGLRQWERHEGPEPDILNDNMDKIDTAIKAVQSLASGKASITLGSYVADEQPVRKINLGFTPKLLILVTREGELNDPYMNGYRVGGIIFPQMSFDAVYISSGGFTVTKPEDQGVHTPNSSMYSPFYYIALR